MRVRGNDLGVLPICTNTRVDSTNPSAGSACSPRAEDSTRRLTVCFHRGPKVRVSRLDRRRARGSDGHIDRPSGGPEAIEGRVEVPQFDERERRVRDGRLRLATHGRKPSPQELGHRRSDLEATRRTRRCGVVMADLSRNYSLPGWVTSLSSWISSAWTKVIWVRCGRRRSSEDRD
jgi:hypothetical protein